MKEPQSWVTFASNNVEALKALVLSRSLRHVITRRRLAIFVSQDVSDEMSELLEFGFDRCFRITNNYCKMRFREMEFTSVAKILAWRFHTLGRIVFLDPNFLALRNSDELFKYDGVMHGKENGKTLMFVGTPTEKRFKRLFKAATSPNSFFALDEKRYFEKMCGMTLIPGKLEKFNISVDMNEMNLSWNPNDMYMVEFERHPIDIIMASKDQAPATEDTFAENTLQRLLYETCLEHLPVHDLEYMLENFPKRAEKKLRSMMEKPPLPLDILDDLRHSVAIVGMGLRLPKANTLDEFWDLLINGKDGISNPPEGRWTSDRCLNRLDSTEGTQAGFLKCPIDEIDAKFFGLSPMELTYMDPQQRLTLQVIWEALEHAGINPSELKQTNTGVFGGWWRHDYKEMLQESGLNESEFFRTYMGNSLGTLTGRISHVLDITGPSISTESGCSTSIVAVDMACKNLLNEDCDLGLAFGVNLLLHPFGEQTLNAVIAPDGHCKTFDANADGFGRAEGCVVLVLKRFADAVRDGDNVHALIRGSAVVQEGPSRSMGTPTKGCEALAMKLALDDACVDPKDVCFVETHGTGTPLGDPLEVAAVAEAYGGVTREQPLIIASVKTNIGHTESCSGIAGIIKTVLAFQHEMMPPHINFETLNPDINLEALPAVIPLSPMKWQKNEDGKPRIAGISSFGITGTDTHVILQECPSPQALPMRSLLNRLTTTPSLHVLKMSTKSADAMDDMMKNMKNFLTTTSHSLEDICYTANVGRGDFQFRTTVCGTQKQELIDQLQKNAVTVRQVPTEVPKLGFLFTGQGSQYPEMAKQLYKDNSVFKFHFDICSKFLKDRYKIDINEAMWGAKQDLISQSIYSQTSIFCVEYALLKLWESWGVKPDLVVGHSLGEFAAAVAAGILTMEDALTLVAERSRLIDGLERGRMIVLKKNQKEVEELMKHAFEHGEASDDFWLDYAAINSTEQTVLAGTISSVERFKNFCENNGIKVFVLQSTHAFHSRMMDPILPKYRSVAEKISYNKPTGRTFISGMEGAAVDAEKTNFVDFWVRHAKEPVRFVDACKSALDGGVRNFIEVGPQPVLSALMMYNADTILESGEPVLCFPSLRKGEDDLRTMLKSVGKMYAAGHDIKWKKFHAIDRVKKVEIPYYPFQNKPYWFDMDIGQPRHIHPLVGSPNPNPSNIKLYQGNLDIRYCRFLKDHVIGNTTIYPGAGFIEQLLVAGYAAYQCMDNDFSHPTTPISLEEIVIEAPLAITEGEKTPVNTIVTTEDSGETRVTVYSKLVLDKETHKWIRHASAVFTPFALQWEGEAVLKNDSLEAVRSRCTEEVATKETYDKFAMYGLKFGPSFQTLQAAWRNENEICFQARVTGFPQAYICYPVILDAMFQAIMIALHSSAESLHVPISITKFIWLGKIETDLVYIHCKVDNEENVAVLYDENGKVLCVMVGLTLMETTVASVLSAVEAQRTALPSMYEEIWKETMGTWSKRLNTFPDLDYLFTEEYRNSFLRFNVLQDKHFHIYKGLNDLCLAYVLQALYSLGWKPQMHKSLTELMDSLGIAPGLKLYIRQWIMELIQEGYLELLSSSAEEDVTFEIFKVLPSHEDVVSSIARIMEDSYFSESSEGLLINAVGQNLADILVKKQPALSILFPGDADKPSAESYYRESHLGSYIWESGILMMDRVLDNILENRQDKSVIRILEVGAGTGSQTKHFLKMLDSKIPAAFEYTFTDLSSHFFVYGEKLFAGSNVKPHFRVLNIEEDPALQGFAPQSFDIIVASFVIHATEDLSTSIAHLRNLLRPGGLFMLSEITKPLRSVFFNFGLVDGFWRFKDRNIRPFNCEMSHAKWESVFRERDFCRVSSFPNYMNHTAVVWAQASDSSSYITDHLTPASKKKCWIIFSKSESQIATSVIGKLHEIGRDVRVIFPGTECKQITEQIHQIRQEEADVQQLLNHLFSELGRDIEGIIYAWDNNSEDFDPRLVCEPFLTLCKNLTNKDGIKLFVLTNGIFSIGDHELCAPSASPLLAMMKTLQNEAPTVSCRCIDLEPNPHPNSAVEDAFAELFDNQRGELFVAFRNRSRHVCRFVSMKLSNTRLSFPKSERFKLLLPASNAIKDLRFGAVENPGPLAKHEVEIRIKAYALNFRDVFVVMKPDPQFDSYKTVGIDYAAEVIAIGEGVTKLQIGDLVVGLNLRGDALPSHIRTSENFLAKIPSHMTLCEAATLPTVGVTAYISLFESANIQHGETILIHTASGGVGLVAVELAQRRGCHIIATAGNVRKREYLKRLGIRHVFNSRNTDYSKKIREALNGGGVDVVLNSLTGPGFKEATLSLLNKGGRFIEMSKLNTWTHEEVQMRRPDVFYDIVILSPTDEEFVVQINHMGDVMKSAEISPIPYVRFDASDIRNALTYLQKAKHIGKIVCVMPEQDKSKAGRGEMRIPLFNDRSTYLITGGLGGIGMEVMKWMTTSGAKHIVLAGRNPPSNKSAEEIKALNTKGSNIITIKCDIGAYEDCKKLLDFIGSEDSSIPPLRGIMHAAGVISDASFENQSWKKYEESFHPKVYGGWNLHLLTQNLKHPLEHFIMFSSCAALVGSPGQSNHVAANFFLDSLVHYRTSLGLPATTINWGQWSQVGVAANLEVLGLIPFSPLQGITALEEIMRNNRVQTAVVQANFGIVRKAFPIATMYMMDLKEGLSEKIEGVQVSPDEFWKEYDAAPTQEERIDVVTRFLRIVVRHILKIHESEAIDDNAQLQDLGMDSLMMIEMKNVLQSVVGSRAKITVNSVKDCTTISQLATRVVKLVSGIEDIGEPTREEFIQLIREDAVLPDHIQLPPNSQKPCKFSDISCILVTGVTGNLGPYVLREICKRKHVSRIYCLMKPHSKQKGKERLQLILSEKGLTSDIRMDIVECIEGNLANDNLGINSELYEKLCEEVDAVFHMGVKSMWQHMYRRTQQGSAEDSRTVNVFGTTHLLQFACQGKPKHFYYSSSTLVSSTLDDGRLLEEWPKVHDFDELPNDAYAVSKFLCELRFAQAVERGIPCKIFRFPLIGGDSRTGGNISALNNQILLRSMSYIALRAVPAFPVPFMLVPVDTCAELSVDIFFKDDTGFEVYNISNPHVNDEQELEGVSEELGYELEVLDTEKFENKLANAADSEVLVFMKKGMENYEFRNRLIQKEEDFPEPALAWLRGDKEVFISRKLERILPDKYPQCMEPSIQILRRDLFYCKKTGIFKRLGLES